MRVLISGAGIAGPSLAWWLSKTGQEVVVVEKASSLLASGQNVDISNTAIKILRKMGLLEEVRKLNTTEQGTQFVNEQGMVICCFPVGKGKEFSPTSEFEILRGDLSNLLYESSKDLPNVEYRFDTTITEVLSNDENSVKVKFSDGSEDSFDLLVAADGQWSKVRKMCFPAESIGTRDFNLMTAYWTAARTPADNDWWNIYVALGRRGVFIRPDPYGTIRACVNRMPRNAAELEKWNKIARSQDKDAQKALIKEEFKDVGWETPRLLESLDSTKDFYFQNVQQIKMKKWSTERVICLGDTAHAPTPLTGMGTSLAIVGSYLLAQELKKLNPDQAPSVAFESFEDLFRPFVEEIQKVPSIVPGVVHPTSAWQRWILWTAISVVSRVFKVVISVSSWFRSSTSKDDQEKEDFKLPNYGDDGGLKIDGEDKKNI